MNILHINMSMDTVKGGGSVERILKLHQALNDVPGINSHILTIDSSEESGHGFKDDKVTTLPCWNKRWYLPVPRFKTVNELIKWADVVHIMNHWTIINAWIYFLVRVTGKPYVVCPAGALTVFGRSKLLKNIYHYITGKRLIKNAFAGIVISKDEIKDLIKDGIREDCIYHVPNGVNEKDFNFNDSEMIRKKLELSKDESYILFVGRLNKIKGPDLLLEAFALLKNKINHHLVFVGPDEGMKDSLEKFVKENDLSQRVHFFGFAGGELKSGLYHGSDLLVVPSRHEAMSIVALEAAITETPVLLSDQCGFSALAEAGGAIETPPTVIDIKENLEELLSFPDKLKKMGESGKLFVQKEFTWKIIAERHLKVFDEILKRAN